MARSRILATCSWALGLLGLALPWKYFLLDRGGGRVSMIGHGGIQTLDALLFATLLTAVGFLGLLGQRQGDLSRGRSVAVLVISGLAFLYGALFVIMLGIGPKWAAGPGCYVQGVGALVGLAAGVSGLMRGRAPEKSGPIRRGRHPASDSDEMKRISISRLLFLILTGAAVSGLLLAWALESRHVSELLAFFWMPLAFTMALSVSILLHRSWAAIQDGRARTSPAAAVGLCFVPLFNLYWIFQAWYGFALDYNAYVRRHRLRAAPLPAGLYLTHCILAVLSAIPFVNFVTALPSFVLLIVVMVSNAQAVNQLAEAELDEEEADESLLEDLEESDDVAPTRRRRTRKRAVVWVGLSLLVVCGAAGAAWYLIWGQGVPFEQVRQKYGPRYAAKREQFKAIAALLPPPGSVNGNTPARDLTPLPVYDAKGRRFNTEIVMYDQLLDPDVEQSAPQRLDLYMFEGMLLMNMRSLGPKSRSQAARDNGRVPDTFVDRCEAALNLPYLVVLRPVEYRRPRAIGEKLFTPGSVDLEGFLVDLRSTKLLGSFRVQAQTPKRVFTTIPGNQSKQQGLERAARGELYESTRAKVRTALTAISGGTFVFDRYRRTPAAGNPKGR